MNRIGSYVLIFILSSCVLLGEDPKDTRLESLSQMSRQGRFRELVEAAKPLLDGSDLNPLERGKAWTFVGYAYQQQGNFSEAIPAYEKALQIMSGNGEETQEYATALSAFSGLYIDMGQPEIARHVLLRALRIYERRSDHAGQAMIWGNLAMIAASQHLKREGHKCVARAIRESGLTNALGDDYFTSLSSTQGRLFELDGNPTEAIAAYEHSLILWEEAHGEQHPEVGWLNVLLGNAYLEAGDIAQANEKIRKGLNRIAATAGPNNAKFLQAEVAYANVLEAMHEHSQASAVRDEANARLTSLSRDCTQCRISAAALR